MQLYAWNKKRQFIFSEVAQKQVDYFCPECRGILRVRGGEAKRRHFFHLTSTPECRQSNKTLEHIHIQKKINLFCPGRR